MLLNPLIPNPAPFLALLLACILGCSPPMEPNDGKPRVVATTGMIADVTRLIGGDAIHVEQLIASGIDPHLYRPTTDDVRSILNADLVLHNGLKLEGRMGDLLRKQGERKPSAAVCDDLPGLLLEGENPDSALDPHCWMDVSMWGEVAKVIEQKLVEIVPEKANEIRERGERVHAELLALDRRIDAWIQTIPSHQRVLISSHDAFQYFGRRYGMRVEGVQGLSTTSEAGLMRVESLVDRIVQDRIPAVFVESSVPEKGIQSLREGAGRKGWNVRLGGTLFTDSMGVKSPTDRYQGMMEHNARTIVEALGGLVE